MLGGLTLLLSVASAACASLIPQLDGYNSSFAHVCNLISSSISLESSVYYPGKKLFSWFYSCCNISLYFEGMATYEKDIYHWGSSSTQHSKCTLEPGSVQDVANVVSLGRVISTTLMWF